jgi:hypothetical protein
MMILKDMKYYKWFWSVPLGGDFDAWGTSTYFLEIGEGAYTHRQIEVYENGNVLSYDKKHVSDDYGRLSDKPIVDDHLEEFEISEAEFEQVWTSQIPMNR